jgi:hypothetical protein
VSFSPIRSVSFDTSFLLHDDEHVDTIIKDLAQHKIPAFITATVLSELEQLKVWGRITPDTYKTAMKRIRAAKATIIDFKNRLLADSFGAACVRAMEEHLNANTTHVINDCRIMITTLKNGINFFLSEDYHFTSAYTPDVITDVTNAACAEYHQLCTTDLYCLNTSTFHRIYKDGAIDLDKL